MKFVCDQCQTKYSIADEKVRRKVLKIRCKNCSNIIVVRESASGQEAVALSAGAAAPVPRAAPVVRAAPVRAAPLPRPAEPRPAEGPGRPKRRSSSTLSPLAVPSRPEPEAMPEIDHEVEPTRLSDAPDFLEAAPGAEDEWFLAIDGNQYGPMAFSELCSRVRRGEARDEAYVWRDGFDEWMELADVPELRPFLPRHPPPPPRGKSGLHRVVLPAPTASPLFGPGTPPAMQPGLPPAVAPVQAAPQPVAVPYPAPPLAPPAQASFYGPGKVASPVPPPQSAFASPPTGPLTPISADLAPPPSAVQVPLGPPLPLVPPPASQDSEIRPLPAIPRVSSEMVPLPVVGTGPGAQPSRTPAWMVIAGVGGGLAALCGLFLVGYSLYVDRLSGNNNKRSSTAVGAGAAHTEGPAPAVAAQPDAAVTASTEFPPMEVDRSDKTRPAGGRPKSHAGSRMTNEQRRLAKLYGDRAVPSGEVPVPPPPSGGGTMRRITPGELMSLKVKHQSELQVCYNRALKRDTSLSEVKVEVVITIGDSGIVRGVSTNTDANPDLVDCIQRAIKRWAFPAIGAQSFSFPILFRATS